MKSFGFPNLPSPFIAVMGGVLTIAAVLAAQQKADFVGNYEGTLMGLHVKLHVTAAPDGNLSATVDSPDQGLVGLSCPGVVVNGQSLSFTVPAVRGTWAGVMSSDRNSLFGIWTQGGNPVPSTLIRVNGSGTETATAPMMPLRPSATSGTAAAVQADAGPPCTGVDVLGAAYYRDGSTWKKMSPPALLKMREGYSLKGGLMTMGGKGGNTAIFRYEDAHAPITLGTLPKFVVCASPSSATANFVIGKLDIKKDYRQIESLSRVEAKGNFIWVPEKRRQPVEVKRISDTAFEIKPTEPLLPGQYLLVLPGITANGTFDFGVQ